MVPVHCRSYLLPCLCDAEVFERFRSIWVMCVLVILPKHLTNKCPVSELPVEVGIISPSISDRRHFFFDFRSFQFP